RSLASPLDGEVADQGGPSLGCGDGAGLTHPRLGVRDELGMCNETNDIVDADGLAQLIEIRKGEAGVGANGEVERGESGGELLHDAKQNGGHPTAASAARPEHGSEGKAMLVEHQQRVVDVVAVVTVEQSELLFAVGDEVGGIEVEHDARRLVAPFGPPAEPFDPQIEQQVGKANQLTAGAPLETGQ